MRERRRPESREQRGREEEGRLLAALEVFDARFAEINSSAHSRTCLQWLGNYISLSCYLSYLPNMHSYAWIYEVEKAITRLGVVVNQLNQQLRHS